MALKPLNLEVGSPRGSNGTRTIDHCPGWYSETSLLHCHQLDLRGRSPFQNSGTFSQAGLDMDFATLALQDDDGDGWPSCPTQQVLIPFVFHQAGSSDLVLFVIRGAFTYKKSTCIPDLDPIWTLHPSRAPRGSFMRSTAPMSSRTKGLSCSNRACSLQRSVPDTQLEVDAATCRRLQGSCQIGTLRTMH